MKKHIKNIGSSSGMAYKFNVDFEIVGYAYILEPYFQELFKTIPDKQVNLIARTYNNVITEIHFDMKVIK